MNDENKSINKSIKQWLLRLKQKKGQTLVEYALILAFISVVAISVLISLGQQVKSTFTKINSELSSAAASH
jgi:Flp pilus assembly pilin Flp